MLHVTNPFITHKDLTIAAPTGICLVDPGEAHLSGGVVFTDPESQGTSRIAVLS